MKNIDNNLKRIVPKKAVKIIVEREFVGKQSISDAFIPIIYEDIRSSVEQNPTFDKDDNIA